MAVKVCLSRMDYDLLQKKKSYQSAGVQEYLAILIGEQEIRWHRLAHGDYELIQPSLDGSLRSQIFPGLLAGDLAAVDETLQLGLQSAQHAEFVGALASRKQRPA